MNTDFTFATDVIYDDKSKPVDVYRVFYKDECIARIDSRNQKAGFVFQDLADEYIRIYGYMAEYRRRWNNGNRVNWSEDLRVVV